MELFACLKPAGLWLVKTQEVTMENFNDMVDVLEAVVFALHGLSPFYAAFIKKTPGQIPNMNIFPIRILRHKLIRPHIRAKPESRLQLGIC